MDRLISPTELSETFGVPIGTIYRWNHLGTGPRVLTSASTPATAWPTSRRGWRRRRHRASRTPNDRDPKSRRSQQIRHRRSNPQRST